MSSFSRSREIALRHAGNRGWLLGVEVEFADVLEAEGFLERARSQAEFRSENWERISEAIEMAWEDQEVFIKAAAHYRIEEIVMVGSFNS